MDEWQDISAITLAALQDTEDGDVVPLAVREYQLAGLFQFEHAEVRGSEGTTLSLKVVRLHGSAGRFDPP